MAITQGTYEIGTGKDYTKLSDAATDGASLTGDLELVVTENLIETATALFDFALNGHKLTVRGSIAANGDPTAARRISGDMSGLFIVEIHNTGPGTVEFKDLFIKRTLTNYAGGLIDLMIYGAGGAYTLLLHDLLFEATDNGRTTGRSYAIDFFDAVPIVKAWNIKMTNYAYGAYFGENLASGSYLENFDIAGATNGVYGNSKTFKMKNSRVSLCTTCFSGLGAATGKNNRAGDATVANGNWLSGTGNVGSITIANEVDSTDPATANFLKTTKGSGSDGTGAVLEIAENIAGDRGVTRPRKKYPSLPVTFTEVGVLPDYIRIHQTLSYNGDLYNIGGNNAAGSVKKVYKSTNDGATWSEVGTDALPMAIEDHIACVADGKMIIFGGSNGGTLPEQEQSGVYSSTNGSTWTKRGDLPVTLVGHQVIVDGDYVYISGGSTQAVPSRKIYRSLATDLATWAEVGTDAMPGARVCHAYVLHSDGYQYIVGGYSTPGNVLTQHNTVWKSTDHGVNWTSVGTLPNAQSYHMGISIDGHILITGGYDGSGKKTAYISADGATWETYDASWMPYTVHQHTMFYHANYVYMVGGIEGSDRYRNVYRISEVYPLQVKTQCVGSDEVAYKTVTYNSNVADSGRVYQPETYVDGATVTVKDNDRFEPMLKTGYTFTGWNTSADGSGTSRAADSTFSMNTSDVTLYAQWVAAGGTTPKQSLGLSIGIGLGL